MIERLNTFMLQEVVLVGSRSIMVLDNAKLLHFLKKDRKLVFQSNVWRLKTTFRKFIAESSSFFLPNDFFDKCAFILIAAIALQNFVNVTKNLSQLWMRI